jgi:hypothetical protein
MLENEPNDIYADWIRLEGEAAMAKFKRWEVREMLTELGQLGRVELFVSGELNDGTRFEGTDTILVINRGNKK